MCETTTTAAAAAETAASTANITWKSMLMGGLFHVFLSSIRAESSTSALNEYSAPPGKRLTFHSSWWFSGSYLQKQRSCRVDDCGRNNIIAIVIAIARVIIAFVVTEAHLVLPVRTDGVTSAVLVGNGILTMTFSAKRVGSNCKILAAECGPRTENTTHLGFEFDVDFQTRASVFFDYRGHLEG
jgi:hypothetical protein